MNRIKRTLLVALCVGLLLATVAPLPALADKPSAPQPFFAAGTVYTISEGQVISMPNSGMWRIAKREMTGGLLAGSITGDFNLSYRGVVDPLQAGDLSGKLDAGAYKMLLEGQSYPVHFWGFLVDPLGNPIFDPYGNPIPVFEITMSGSWKLTKGAQGSGTFMASGVFIPTPDGQHIAQVIPWLSSVVLTGTWSP